MKRTELYLEESQWKKLESLKKEKGESAAHHIREAIDLYLMINSDLASHLEEAKQIEGNLPTAALIARIVSVWSYDRKNNSKRGALQRIEDQIAELKAMIGDSQPSYTEQDRKLYDALVDIRSRLLVEDTSGVVRDLNFWISVYEPPGEDG